MPVIGAPSAPFAAPAGGFAARPRTWRRRGVSLGASGSSSSVAAEATTPPAAPPAATPPPGTGGVPPAGNKLKRAEPRMVSPTEAKALAARPLPMSLADAMAASGPAPEIINCRLAMLAFVTCAALEVKGGGDVVSQATAAGPAVAVLVGLTTLASLIPICAGLHGKRQGPGPFTLDAELLNGRLAAVAFAAQIVLELQFQNTLF